MEIPEEEEEETVVSGRRCLFRKISVIIILVLLLSLPPLSSAQLSLYVAQPTTIRLPSGSRVEDTTAGSVFVCERVHIHGLSRLHNLQRYAHSLKLKLKKILVAQATPAEVCLHRNVSLPTGMCPQTQWEKLVQGSWVHSMSPYDDKLLDIRARGSSLDMFELSIEQELVFYRLVLLVLGIVLLILAPSLSKSIVFYYSGFMAVGVILVILMVLLQGMRLLPTGRKNSLPIVIYASLVGAGSFGLRYLPQLLHALLVEFGIKDEVYTLLVTMLLVCIVLAGAWLGFWVVHKLVLTEDGSVNLNVATFIAWSMRVFSAVIIVQSSLDPLLAGGALVSGILFSSTVRWILNSRMLHRLQRHVFRTMKRNKPKPRIQDSHSESPHVETMPKHLSESETYYSTFHDTPERKRFSKEEWENFTRNSTKKALEELVSSPDFSKWAVRNAERITLVPPTNDGSKQRSRWLSWL